MLASSTQRNQMRPQDTKVAHHGARGCLKRKIINCISVILIIASTDYTRAAETEGEWCINDDGEEGICRRIHQCQRFLDKLPLYHFVGPNTPGLCGYSETDGAIACCVIEEKTTTIDYAPYFPDISNVRRLPSVANQPSPSVYENYGAEGPAEINRQVDSVPLRISEQMCRAYEAEVGVDDDCYIMPRPVQLIVGGYRVRKGEYPHMAALGYLRSSTVVWGCGGTLISHRFILTAAHCRKSPTGRQLIVARLGELLVEDTNWSTLIRSTSLRSGSSGNHPIGRVIAHPDYKPSSVYNDIALAELLEPIRQFDEYVRPACLYTQPDTAGFERAVATGWGDTQDGGDNLKERPMMQVDLNLYGSQTCSREYSAESLTARLSRGIDDTILCAGDENGKKDTCQGDSGGPLQVRSRDLGCFHRVLAVTSVGKRCGARFALYTRVSSYIPWIESVVWPQGRDQGSRPRNG